MGFRDENVVVIEVGSSTTRAVVGLNESMTPPQVRVVTKIGVKRKQESSPDKPNPAQPQYLFAEELEEAIKAKDHDLDVISPVVGGIITDWEAIEIFWYGDRLTLLT
jgi:actin-related protein 9